jgi:hypothetical protein
MALKNSWKPSQALSPENYIRNRSRSLPVYECLVSPEWKETGMTHVVVSRSHTNGNITACIYLVDLYCLGVKDCFYLFNASMEYYREKIEAYRFEQISYALAHNIIYSAVAFAEEFGFKPYKDFTSITRFMLDEDTEDVELIEIECGKNGKPMYVCGPYDDRKKAEAIIAQLERAAGKGNYDYILPGSDDDYYQGADVDYQEEDDDEMK